MIGLSNSASTSPTRSAGILKRIANIGGLTFNSAASNGIYSMLGSMLATFPAGHGFTTGQQNIGTASIHLKNVTQGYTERGHCPIHILAVVGNTIFLRNGASESVCEFTDFGLTNPAPGDTIKTRFTINIKGYIMDVPFTVTSLLS